MTEAPTRPHHERRAPTPTLTDVIALVAHLSGVLDTPGVLDTTVRRVLLELSETALLWSQRLGPDEGAVPPLDAWSRSLAAGLVPNPPKKMRWARHSDQARLLLDGRAAASFTPDEATYHVEGLCAWLDAPFSTVGTQGEAVARIIEIGLEHNVEVPPFFEVEEGTEWSIYEEDGEGFLQLNIGHNTHARAMPDDGRAKGWTIRPWGTDDIEAPNLRAAVGVIICRAAEQGIGVPWPREWPRTDDEDAARAFLKQAADACQDGAPDIARALAAAADLPLTLQGAAAAWLADGPPNPMTQLLPPHAEVVQAPALEWWRPKPGNDERHLLLNNEIVAMLSTWPREDGSLSLSAEACGPWLGNDADEVSEVSDVYTALSLSREDYDDIYEPGRDLIAEWAEARGFGEVPPLPTDDHPAPPAGHVAALAAWRDALAVPASEVDEMRCPDQPTLEEVATMWPEKVGELAERLRETITEGGADMSVADHRECCEPTRCEFHDPVCPVRQERAYSYTISGPDEVPPLPTDDTTIPVEPEAPALEWRKTGHTWRLWVDDEPVVRIDGTVATRIGVWRVLRARSPLCDDQAAAVAQVIEWGLEQTPPVVVPPLPCEECEGSEVVELARGGRESVAGQCQACAPDPEAVGSAQPTAGQRRDGLQRFVDGDRGTRAERQANLASALGDICE